jgi:hypothetical protein
METLALTVIKFEKKCAALAIQVSNYLYKLILHAKHACGLWNKFLTLDRKYQDIFERLLGLGPILEVELLKTHTKNYLSMMLYLYRYFTELRFIDSQLHGGISVPGYWRVRKANERKIDVLCEELRTNLANDNSIDLEVIRETRKGILLTNTLNHHMMVRRVDEMLHYDNQLSEMNHTICEKFDGTAELLYGNVTRQVGLTLFVFSVNVPKHFTFDPFSFDQNISFDSCLFDMYINNKTIPELEQLPWRSVTKKRKIIHDEYSSGFTPSGSEEESEGDEEEVEEEDESAAHSYYGGFSPTQLHEYGVNLSDI